MKEVLTYYWPEIEKSDVLSRLNLEPRRFLVVSAHREENVDSEQNLSDLLDSLNALAAKFNLPVIVSTHPRTRRRLEQSDLSAVDPQVHFLKPLGLFDYVRLQTQAFCVVSDSGTITEESSLLGFPAVTIRQAHERPEGMDEGTLIMCGLKRERVIEAVETVTAQHREDARQFRTVPDYDVDNVSKKVVRIILSYIDYVNRTVWYK
jgi:UDP-N-acetylglucosamine 2-epimerase (non-hydrolysing)